MTIANAPKELPEHAEFRKEIAAWLRANTPANPGFLLPQTFMEVGSDQVLDFLREWQFKVWSAGYLGMAWPKQYGGQGAAPIYQSIVDQEMKRLRVPICFNVIGLGWAGPLILDIGSDMEKEKYLKGILNADDIWAQGFSEPNHGSDLGSIQTRAERDGDDYVINGRKWYITGAGEAAHFILMAKTGDGARDGLTAFLFHRDDPGWRIERRIGIMGPEEHGGHCELVFDGMELDDDRVLMGEGKGLKVTQIRLGLARLTHCMRWLGLAKRAVDIAADYAAHRTGFGIKLIDRESIQMKLGQAAMDIEIGRVMVMRAAWRSSPSWPNGMKRTSVGRAPCPPATWVAVSTWRRLMATPLKPTLRRLPTRTTIMRTTRQRSPTLQTQMILIVFPAAGYHREARGDSSPSPRQMKFLTAWIWSEPG